MTHRSLTAARVFLPRAGAALATAPLLELRRAQARARDAVWAELDVASLAAALPETPLIVQSAAVDRRQYLMRPDLGRALDPASAAPLEPGAFDLALVVADGLSARAAERHAPPVLAALLPRLGTWRLGPIVIARQARVALGDKVAAALGARAVLILIGERPGLSAPDSLGAYLTWAPGAGTTDAARNCVSNIRPDGLGYAAAARTLLHLLQRMRELGSSGVSLKDTAEIESVAGPDGHAIVASPTGGPACDP